MISAIITAFAGAGLLSLLLVNARGRWVVLDIPNPRSLHTRPTPRTGGIAILLGAGSGLLVVQWQGYTAVSPPLTAAVVVLALVALLDDRHALGPVPRLLIQLLTVTWLLLTRQAPDLGSLTVTASGLFLVWMINLYNFMDGMDGFAGGMAVFGFGTFALQAWSTGHMEFALGSAVIAAAATGFLLLNFPPARLFMGDVGSTALGLLAGIVMLQAHAEGILPIWLGVLVFSPFIVDASVTLARRILRGERFWEAHKTHYYQKLVESGWGHRKTVLAEYGLMAGCCGSALLASRLPLAGQISLISGWAVIYAALMRIISGFYRTQGKRI
jgi:UDP-N-acetylmuramyl pentapeptide phosphotransferase/UDP-N-acetylglucosamine-1-phosphate transferase